MALYDGQRVGSDHGLAAPPWSDNATNNVAEYTALIEGLKWCKAKGHTDFVARGDSQLVVRQIQGSYAVRAPRIVPLYQQAAALVRELRVRMEWVPREQNALADQESVNAYVKCWRDEHEGKDPPPGRHGPFVLIETNSAVPLP